MMEQKRRFYDREFKQTAVGLSYAKGNAMETAHELGSIPFKIALKDTSYHLII